jgi:hypothetical protein
LEHPYDNPSFDFNLVTRALGVSPDPYEPDEGYLPGYATLMARIEIDKGDTHSLSDPPGVPEDDIYRAMIDEDEHELEWHYDPENIDDSFFKADTEHVHVLAGAIDRAQPHRFYRGVLSGGTIDNIALTTSALIAVILLQDTPDFRTYLIIATGKLENTGFRPQPYSPGPPPLFNLPEPQEIYWGHEPILVEGIGAEILLPVSAGSVIEFLTLTPEGSDGVGLDPEPHGEQCILRLSPDNETLWYRFVIRI